MKAITIRQPWAGLIACGRKFIETRTHPRLQSLVGERFAIHAALRFDPEAAGVILRRCSIHGIGLPYPYSMLRDSTAWPRGCIVALTVARAHYRLTDLDDIAVIGLTRDLWGLRLGGVQPLDPPIPARGRQGIWNWTPPESLNLTPGD